MLLTQILANKGFISQERHAGAPTDVVQNELFAIRLLEDKEITPIQLLAARAERLHVPFADLSEFVVSKIAVAQVSADLARRHSVIPLRIQNNELFLGVSSLTNILALDEVRAASGLTVHPVLVDPELLLEALQRNYRLDDDLGEVSSSIEDTSSGVLELLEIDTVANDAPIVRFVNAIITQAIQDRASDIHIEPGEHDLRIRYRIDGVLHEMQRESKKIQPGVISRIKIMSEMDIAERRKPQDGRMTFGGFGDSRDLRVATLPTVWGETIILRILDNGSVSHSISNLGFLKQNQTIFERSITKTSGMILVTGPTGSGKSTTLYATLSEVSTPQVNVITVEDPVEYRLANIKQVQVNPRAGLTFASALRSILRSDPDVILVGEIRDHDTAQIAMEASLTGHLVLSTLHTNNAPASITRLIELGVEPFMVASSISTVIAQRLARRLCPNCKAESELSEAMAASLKSDYAAININIDGIKFMKPVGCNHCSKTGYRGRLAIHEVLEVTEEIAAATMSRLSSGEISKIAMSQGMLSLRQDGLAKAAMGQTSLEEVFRVLG